MNYWLRLGLVDKEIAVEGELFLDWYISAMYLVRIGLIGNSFIKIVDKVVFDGVLEEYLETLGKLLDLQLDEIPGCVLATVPVAVFIFVVCV